MKIGFDARMIDHPGIGRYIRSLLAAIVGENQEIELILYGDTDKLAAFKNCKREEYKDPIYNWREFFFSPFGKREFDVVHIPHFNVPFKYIKNLVVTIHDLIYLKLPGSSPPFGCRAVKPIISNAVRRAKKLIAVSENTRKDIIEIFPDAKDKIEVIYEAPDPIFKRVDDEDRKETVRQKHSLPKDMILFVGSLKRHKNIERLIDAYSDLKSKGIEHRLVIIGRYRPREKQILKKIKSTDALYLGEVSTEDLVAIYNLASLLVIPSLYEGFGLPVLEAMACGVPVVASSAASLPEVVGDAGILCDPYDISDISNKVYKVLVNKGLRQVLIEKGFKRVGDFSWEKAAKQTLEVYRKVLRSTF